MNSYRAHHSPPDLNDNVSRNLKDGRIYHQLKVICDNVLFQKVTLFIPLTVEVVFVIVGVVGVIVVASFMKLYKWIMNARQCKGYFHY